MEQKPGYHFPQKDHPKRHKAAGFLLALLLLSAISCVFLPDLSFLSFQKNSSQNKLPSTSELVQLQISTRTPGILTQMVITKTLPFITLEEDSSPLIQGTALIKTTGTPIVYHTSLAKGTPSGGGAIATLTKKPAATATWYILYFPTRTPIRFPTHTPTRTFTPRPTSTKTRTPTPTGLTLTATQSTSTSTGTSTPTNTVTFTPTTTTTPSPTVTNTSTAVPSPLAEQIAFSADQNGDGSLDVLRMNPDGSAVQAVVMNDQDSVVCDWSPNGEKLIYSGLRGDPAIWQLYFVLADGTQNLLLAGLPVGENRQAAWSPDGNWILFQNINPSGQADLYIIRTTGTDLRQLTDNSAAEFTPDWNSDGTAIVFVSDIDGKQKIYSLDIAGQLLPSPSDPADPVLLVDPGTDLELASPHWAADRLIFSGSDGTQSDIFVIDFSLSASPANLTNPDGADTFNDFSPSWSRDGSQIAFISDRSGVNEIYTISSSGGDPVLVPNAISAEVFPNWMP